jgi:hypothetical protein
MHYLAAVARTPAQRGRIGNWLVESRLSRGWDTQEKARSEIERLTGWRIPQSVYAEWESGRRVPSDANLARLTEFYGGGESPVMPDQQQALIAALRAQTEAINALVARLDSLAGEAVREGVADALREAGVARVVGGSPDVRPGEQFA